MTRTVQIDPVRSAEVYNSWRNAPPQKIIDTKSWDYLQGGDAYKGRVGIAGTDLLDGAAHSLLKAEFLAAQAGVVPFVPLPGGGQGVLTVGGALSQPDHAWPDPLLRTLYLANHRGMSAIHAETSARRITTPELVVPELAPVDIQSVALEWGGVGAHGATLGVIPAIAWVAIAAVGILATIAATYYATRTKETEIETESELLNNQFKMGKLTDLAIAQLQTKGHIQPDLIKAIAGIKGSTSNSYFWPGVALGVGGVVITATGVAVVVIRRKGRRR